MASFPSKILLLSISSTPRSGHGDGEGDGEGDGDHGTDTTEKKKKSNKGDCICIAKKIALIDEFNALRDGGCTKPNHEPHLFFLILVGFSLPHMYQLQKLAATNLIPDFSIFYIHP